MYYLFEMLGFSLYTFSVLCLPFIRAHFRPDSRQAVETPDSLKGPGYVFVLPYLFAILILVYPPSRYFPLPGGDAVLYVANAVHTINRGVLWAFWNTERPFVSLVIASLTFMFKSYSVGLMLFNVISGIILVYGVDKCLQMLGIGPRTRVACCILSVTLPAQVLRHAADLYASFFAYGVSFAFFANLMEYLQNGKRRTAILSTLSLIMTALSHFENFLVILGVICAYVFLEFTLSLLWRTNGGYVIIPKILRILAPTCLALLPFAIVALSYTDYYGIASRWLGPVNERYGIGYFQLPTKPFSWYDDPHWGVLALLHLTVQGYGELVNIPVFLLVVLGTAYVAINDIRGRILLSWNALAIPPLLYLFKLSERSFL